MTTAGLLHGMLGIAATASQAVTTAPAMSQGLHDFLVNTLYAISAIFFVFGLKMLSSPRTARKGNVVAAFGMLMAVVITLASEVHIDYT